MTAVNQVNERMMITATLPVHTLARIMALSSQLGINTDLSVRVWAPAQTVVSGAFHSKAEMSGAIPLL